VGKVVKSIFGGGGSDNSAQMRQMELENQAQRAKMDAQQKKLDDEERKRQEALAASGRAKRGGGARSLLSAQRLNPEVGVGEQTSLGPQV
jgi:hypothetical protein